MMKLKSARSLLPLERLSPSDLTFVLALTIACAISYSVTVYILHPIVDRDNDLLGGMWATVATAFVFRNTHDQSLRAAIARLFATCISFAVCLLYLLIFPFSAIGMAVLVGIGTVAVMAFGRRDDVIATGITTIVVMVVAALDPTHRKWMPALRLVDTLIGIIVGVAIARLCKALFAQKKPQT